MSNMTELNNKQIIDARKTINDQLKANVFTTGKNKNKEAMIAEMENRFTEGTTSIVKSADTYIQVKLTDIDVHPCNMRAPADYMDRSFDDKIDLAGGLVKDPVISSRVIKREDGTSYHPVIAGNRSVVALRRVVCERWKLDPNEYTIQVKVRNYEGDTQEQIAQEMMDLQVDNDTHLKPSVIDNLKMIRHYETLGFSPMKIAQVMGKSPSMISITKNFGLLPERIQKLVDAEVKREMYSTLTEADCKNFGIEYTVTDPSRNAIEIKGILMNKARAMFEYLPSMRAKGQDDFEQSLLDAHDLIELSIAQATDPNVSAKEYAAHLALLASSHPGFKERDPEQRRDGKKPPVEAQAPETPVGSVEDSAPTPPPASGNSIANALAQQAQQNQERSNKPVPEQVSKPAMSAPAQEQAEDADKKSEAYVKRCEAGFKNSSGYPLSEAIDQLSDGTLRLNEELNEIIHSDYNNPTKQALVERLILTLFKNGHLSVTNTDIRHLAVPLLERDTDLMRDVASMIEIGWIS